MSEREDQAEDEEEREVFRMLVREAVAEDFQRLHASLSRLEQKMSNQFTDLDTDVQGLAAAEDALATQLGTTLADVQSKLADLEAKLAAAGTPPDITADISQIATTITKLQDMTAQLASADPGATPAPAPVTPLAADSASGPVDDARASRSGG